MKDLTPIRISANGHDFLIELEAKSNFMVTGTVVELAVTTGEETYYKDACSSDITESREDAREWLEFCYQWRGCWCDELNFKYDMFNFDDIDIVPELLSRITNECKAIIKGMNPDHNYMSQDHSVQERVERKIEHDRLEKLIRNSYMQSFGTPLSGENRIGERALIEFIVLCIEKSK